MGKAKRLTGRDMTRILKNPRTWIPESVIASARGGGERLANREAELEKRARTLMADEEACEVLGDEVLAAAANYYFGELTQEQREIYEAENKSRVEAHLRDCFKCRRDFLQIVRNSAQEYADNIVKKVIGEYNYQLADTMWRLWRRDSQC